MITLTDTAREQSSLALTVGFRDEDGTAVIPDTIAWTLSKEDGTVVNSRADVSVGAPAAAIEIFLQGDDLAILDDDPREKRIVTVEAVYDTTKLLKEDIAFFVENLVGVS